MHWLIFVGIGPPIGLLSALILSTAVTGEFDTQFLMNMAVIGLPASYIYGLIPALAAAFAVQRLQARHVSHEGLWVSLIGLGIGFIYVGLIATLVGESPGSVMSDVAAIYAFTCLLPTLACWRLSKRLARPSRPQLL
jgi:Na+/phosphate symporter